MQRLDGKSLVHKFEDFVREAVELEEGKKLAFWQYQATGEIINKAAAYAAVFDNKLTSILLAAKPNVDALILP